MYTCLRDRQCALKDVSYSEIVTKIVVAHFRPHTLCVRMMVNGRSDVTHSDLCSQICTFCILPSTSKSEFWEIVYSTSKTYWPLLLLLPLPTPIFLFAAYYYQFLYMHDREIASFFKCPKTSSPSFPFSPPLPSFFPSTPLLSFSLSPCFWCVNAQHEQ